ncbi:MAG: GNAT family protein [Erythrobacter sp.]
MIDWAFASHRAPHLVALTSDSNVASWKLMRKLGMERRNDLDFHDPFFADDQNPTIQYSLTSDQWEETV